MSTPRPYKRRPGVIRKDPLPGVIRKTPRHVVELSDKEEDEDDDEDDESEDSDMPLTQRDVYGSTPMEEQRIICPHYTINQLNYLFKQKNTFGFSKLEIFDAGVAGRAVRTRKNIRDQSKKLNEYICVYSYNLSDAPPKNDFTYSYQFDEDNKEIFAYVADYDRNFEMGPFLNDPLDDDMVNCGLRMAWIGNHRAAVVYAKTDITRGEQCFLGYGKSYWVETLQTFRMPTDLRLHVVDRLQYML
jgi:hypothetical protein